MAYNTRAIKTDLNNRPIPQYFNPVVDDYEALQGENGANRVLLWGSNNQPLLTETNAGYVRAADGALATIGALADAAQTSPTAEASVVALLKGVLTRLQAGADGAAPSDVVDRAARELGRISAVDGAIAALGTLADAAVTDPATSGAVIGLLKGLLQTLQGSPNVTLSGRNVQPTKLTITENPLNAGGWSPEPAVLDVLASPGVAALEYVVSSDQPITCEWYSGDGSGSQPAGGAANRKLAITLSPSPVGGSQIIPAFRPPGISVRRTFRNSGTQAATFTRIYELRHHSPVLHPQNLRAVLAHQLAIRDTTEHTVDTDPNYLFPLSRIWLGGGKVPIYVRNGLDQALTVSVVLVIEGLINATLGTVSVPASSTKVVTNSDFAGIDVPSETIRLTLKCSTAPTTGTVSAYIDTLVGGSA